MYNYNKYSKANKINCKVCNKEFITKASCHIYCSKECGEQYKSMRHKIEADNINRWEIFQRDNFKWLSMGAYRFSK